MADISSSAKKAYKKALKAKKKKLKTSHWLFIQKGDSGKEIASKVFTQFAVLVLIVCIAILGNELRLSISTKQLNTSLQDLYNKYISSEIFGEKGELLPSANALLAINEDTAGWVTIEDTNINLPVVLRKTSDGNEYYLNRSFDGSTNKAGTLFLDYRSELDYKDRSDNLIIYGHNQKDKTMFGDLANYKKNIEFYRDHPIIKFSSNYVADDYKIFAFFVTPVEPHQTADGIIFDYHNYIDLSDREVFDEFIDNINLRNEITTPVDVKFGDEILTLSTCSNEFEPSRFVVFARKVRENEDTVVETNRATINPNAKEPDWSVIYG
ncbi:MAG: class B sortase [Ruminococcus sp.]|jgi:sortase B|nr:class B sortase [Ruminococcus sp.]